MTGRRALSTTRRVKVFEEAGGRCHICGQKIFGKGWEVEHVIPLALGGADNEDNMRPAHEDCHKGKTRTDNASWSKAKRVRAKHVGAYRSSNPIPGSKGTPYRKRMNGNVERRT